MGYISNEQVKEKRKAIKNAFPNWKFSITRKNHSSINVAILEADVKLTDKPYESVNHYYIKDHYKDSPETAKSLQKLVDIMEKGNEIVTVDADYGAIPDYYIHLTIGEWDKPFKFSK